ncbi:MAG: 2,3-bisphosphoglycerate-independent phosphoglycerate mutase [Patescibacteria group bacterium]
MKILFIVIDGLADRPIKQLGNKTPLEAARTPNLDWLAQRGKCGLVEPVFTQALPTSEEGHFGLFGYDPRKYKIKRGIFTAQAAGLKIQKTDVALRGNFAFVADNLTIIDRRAGRIENTEPLIKSLNGIVIQGVKFIVKAADGHRLAIVMRGRGLSSAISDSDPQYYNLAKKALNVLPLSKDKKACFAARRARFTAEVLNEFLTQARQLLKQHPLNQQRIKKGLPPANYVLTRGASSVCSLPSFKQKYGLKAAVVAGKLLYQQIGRALGMSVIKVKGADGTTNTNLGAKFAAAKNALTRNDFVFCHIKATDTLAENGDFAGKKAFIEKIDQALGPITKLENVLIVITADHATCCLLKRHCQGPAPLLVYGLGHTGPAKFSERNCQKGGLGKISALQLMSKLLKWRR